jgi:hypothetical protein
LNQPNANPTSQFTWMSMLAGFAALGFLMRRRHVAISFA